MPGLKPDSPWQSTPRKAVVIFLLAVFCIFASFGFVSDSINMGRQPAPRYVISVLLSGLFAVSYAASGIRLRRKFWIVFLPLFILQIVIMGLLNRWMPDAPALIQLDAAQTSALHGRITLNGLAVIVSVTLGYIGFLWVSISEGRRHIRLQMEKASLESEMAAAREIQRAMVPEDLPPVDGYTIESVYRPASEVGGDFFQVIPLKSGRTLVVIGDVSGKGLSAAMIVSMLVGMLRTVSGFTEEPADILAELNRRLCGRTQGGFATCIVLRLEAQGRLTLANAGHPPPYVNAVELPWPGSMPLGLLETTTYAELTIDLHIGDTAVLLTDGILEARNEQRILLGFDRVASLLREKTTALSLADFAQHYGQDDDITVLRITNRA